MPYSEFPFFRDASVGKISNVEQATPGDFYWPDLDGSDARELDCQHPAEPRSFQGLLPSARGKSPRCGTKWRREWDSNPRYSCNNNASRYYWAVIRSFAEGETEKVFRRERSQQLPPDVQRRAHRKLLLVHAAERVDDLRIPPGNRLERLKGDRRGQHSIRINDQWRICFRWSGGDAFDVEITDYH